MKYENEIVNQICRLIEIRSVKDSPLPGKPYGAGVSKALDFMLALGEELGFRSKNIDGYAGHIEFGDGEEIVAVLVHLDTVPEGDGWINNPFEGTIRDGLIIGRGASDNKGPAVVAVYALAALRDCIANPNRRVRVIFGTDEESGMNDMDYYFSKEPLPTYSFTPDASYPIINAEKGYLVIKIIENKRESDLAVMSLEGGKAPNVVPDLCTVKLKTKLMTTLQMRKLMLLSTSEDCIELRIEGELLSVTVHGKSGHGSYPPSGVNAVAKMLKILSDSGILEVESHSGLSFVQKYIGNEAFGESLDMACSHPAHGKLTVNLAAIHADEDQVETVLNIRYPVTEDCEELLEMLKEKCKTYKLEMLVEHHMLPLHIPEDHPLIKLLGKAYETVTGEPVKLLSIGGGTYARKLKNTGVAFGAGFPGVIHGPGPHQPDECVSISDLMRHGQITTQAMYELATNIGNEGCEHNE